MAKLTDFDRDVLKRIAPVSSETGTKFTTTQALRAARRLVKKRFATEKDGRFFKTFTGHSEVEVDYNKIAMEFLARGTP